MRVPFFPSPTFPIEVSSTPGARAKRPGRSRAAAGNQTHARSGTRGARALPFSALSNSPSRFGLSTQTGEGAVGKGLSLGESGGNGFERGVKLMGVHGRVFAAVDAGLSYPEEFIEKEIEGVVHADLTFTGEGRWLAESSRVKSTNGFLRVYIRRLLPKVLGRGFHTNFREGFTLKATFLFERKRHVPFNQGEQRRQILIAAAPSPSGPHLYFERTHHLWLPIEYAMYSSDRPTLDGRPPGLRTGVGVNVLPILVDGLSALGELISPTPKGDPLEKYRIDPYWAQE